MTTCRDTWKAFETYVADQTGGVRIPMSGALSTAYPDLCIDVVNDWWAIECKYSGGRIKKGRNIQFELGWLSKSEEEAKKLKRKFALVFTFKRKRRDGTFVVVREIDVPVERFVRLIHVENQKTICMYYHQLRVNVPLLLTTPVGRYAVASFHSFVDYLHAVKEDTYGKNPILLSTK